MLIEGVRVPDSVLKPFLVIINVPFSNRSLEFCEWNEVYYDVTPKHSNHSSSSIPSHKGHNNGRYFGGKKMMRVSAFQTIDIY